MVCTINIAIPTNRKELSHHIHDSPSAGASFFFRMACSEVLAEGEYQSRNSTHQSNRICWRLLVGHCQKTILAACLQAVVIAGEFGGHICQTRAVALWLGLPAVSVASTGGAAGLLAGEGVGLGCGGVGSDCRGLSDARVVGRWLCMAMFEWGEMLIWGWVACTDVTPRSRLL